MLKLVSAVIVSTIRAEDRGFESRQGVRFLELNTYNTMLFFVTKIALLLFVFE
jgi:hypothetical protein